MERFLGALGIEVPNQFFGLTTEPTSPPDLPEVVGLNDVISQFNSPLTTLSAKHQWRHVQASSMTQWVIM